MTSQVPNPCRRRRQHNRLTQCHILRMPTYMTSTNGCLWMSKATPMYRNPLAEIFSVRVPEAHRCKVLNFFLLKTFYPRSIKVLYAKWFNISSCDCRDHLSMLRRFTNSLQGGFIANLSCSAHAQVFHPMHYHCYRSCESEYTLTLPSRTPRTRLTSTRGRMNSPCPQASKSLVRVRALRLAIQGVGYRGFSLGKNAR